MRTGSIGQSCPQTGGKKVPQHRNSMYSNEPIHEGQLSTSSEKERIDLIIILSSIHTYTTPGTVYTYCIRTC